MPSLIGYNLRFLMVSILDLRMSTLSLPPLPDDVLTLLKDEQIDQEIYHDALELKRIMHCYAYVKSLFNSS